MFSRACTVGGYQPLTSLTINCQVIRLEPMIFGHAIYEMATRPYLGLTAKLWPMLVPEGIYELVRCYKELLLSMNNLVYKYLTIHLQNFSSN